MHEWKKSLVIVVMTACALVALAVIEPSIVADETSTGEPDQNTQSTEESKPVLDGAKVFGWYCGACHSERYPRERTDAEWEVIVTHMRVRSNLTGEQADAVLHYLKENNE